MSSGGPNTQSEGKGKGKGRLIDPSDGTETLASETPLGSTDNTAQSVMSTVQPTISIFESGGQLSMFYERGSRGHSQTLEGNPTWDEVRSQCTPAQQERLNRFNTRSSFGDIDFEVAMFNSEDTQRQEGVQMEFFPDTRSNLPDSMALSPPSQQSERDASESQSTLWVWPGKERVEVLSNGDIRVELDKVPRKQLESLTGLLNSVLLDDHERFKSEMAAVSDQNDPNCPQIFGITQREYTEGSNLYKGSRVTTGSYIAVANARKRQQHW